MIKTQKNYIRTSLHILQQNTQTRAENVIKPIKSRAKNVINVVKSRAKNVISTI